MIYFIDEEDWLVKPYCEELKWRGCAVKNITTATDAYRELSDEEGVKNENIDLVIFDVMLAVDPDDNLSGTLFTRQKTDDFLRTGLVLLDLLIEKRPKVFPSRALIFSGVSDARLVEVIQDKCTMHDIKFMRKEDYTIGVDFADHIESIIKRNSGTTGQ